MTDMKKFFTALSERAYKENDLSDVTYAMCESDICFKQFFLDFFFDKESLDASSTSIEREHSTDWGRPDFWIRKQDGTLYIVEVKIWDGKHHFEQYYDILAGKDVQGPGFDRTDKNIWQRLGYIANYEAVENVEVTMCEGTTCKATDLCKVATWKSFVEKLEGDKKFKDPIIMAYVQYVRNVCPFDDFNLKKWINDKTISNLTKAFPYIQKVANGVSGAIVAFQQTDNGKTINFMSYTRSSRKFIPQYRMGSFFEFDLDNDRLNAQKQRVWGWLGIYYYRNDGGVICIEFEDRDGWGKPVCDKFRSRVKDGALRFYLSNKSLDYDNIQDLLIGFLRKVINAVIAGVVDGDCPIGDAGKFESLLAMKAFPIMLEQKLFGANTVISIGSDSYKFSLASGSDAEVPESHCGRYFELTKSTSGQQSLSEQKISVRGWVGVMYSSNHKYKNEQIYSEAPQCVIEIEKNFANAQLNGRSNSAWYDDSWGWKCYDISGAQLCDLTSKVSNALQSLSDDKPAK